MSAFLTYALDRNDNIVYIEDAAYGNACECFCPHCSAPLVAKNHGPKRDHHFAHYKHHECKGAYETMLHRLAKELIAECGVIMLPSEDGWQSGPVELRDIEVEKWDEENGFRPDLEGIMPDGKRLLIEFLVSHRVSRNKHDLIIEKGLRCIEIDLRYQNVTKESLRKFLVESSECRTWIKPYEKMSQHDGLSCENVRSPWHEKAIEYLKKSFEEEDISICPFGEEFFSLRKYGYDVCETNTKFRGFKSDLLLFRSKPAGKGKGYISINFRSRVRNKKRRYPNDLRIVDIIIRDDNDLYDFMTGNTLPPSYFGAWKK